MAVELGRDKTVAEIIARLKAVTDGGGVVKVEGTWGSFAPLLAGHISEALGRAVLYVRPHIDDAEKAADDLHTFGAKNICLLPAWEGAIDLADATDEIRAERLRIVSGCSALKTPAVIATSVQALCQPIPNPQVLRDSCLGLKVCAEFEMEKILGWLVDNGFEKVERIDMPGQFAHRGGIVDIFAPVTSEKKASEKQQSQSSNGEEAIRIEFFGDTIESIRQINLDNHRSTEQIESINIISVTCGSGNEHRELFINILPKETVIIFEEPCDIQEVANVYLERIEDRKPLFKWTDIFASAGRFTQMQLSRFADSAEGDYLKLNIKSTQLFQHKAASLWAGHKESLEELVGEAERGKKVYFYCERQAEIKRVKEIVEQGEKKLPLNFKLCAGFINQGFVIASLDTIVISHHELFDQFAIRRRQRPSRAAMPIDTLTDLQQGDYVVHASYGIGKFLGIKTIKEKAGTSEYLTIEYADKALIHVSVKNITLVQKYIGTSPKRPKLSKVGSKKWLKQKKKVAESVHDLACALLEVQANRKAMGGTAFAKDSEWQVEFEESFPYSETADQITAAEQIKADMQEPVAMDRLLCGDVGYGKTELAMRAAFKAVENGKQVAVLVPTTVLCVQHERTFNERFADFPVCIESLNRFKTATQAVDIISRAKSGRVDILIGTHRLLSGDVGFKDLGLLIIDEEQRFGVEHKEKLKQLRVNVDILTMTATPIPRTLHMSMLGLRDISSLATAPMDRRSVITTVVAYNENLIRKAIYRELNRQGQVFFLHNRVKTIDKKAWSIRKLLNDSNIKISIAHGQMAKSELEKAMIEFVTGKTNVLICTTIIESGLDIPNANTIFIDNADRFGLAQLHQLRGRVGRYKHKAYAYMLLSKSRSINPVASRRLKAIEEYSHLGAGFRIALRDLEIRGAGNILGSEQSGYIQVVGYQMYCELLERAVRELKGESVELIPTAFIDLGFAVYIPKNYMPSDRLRMDAYRKIAVAKTKDDLEQVSGELADVYGPIPEDVEMLLELAELRIKASESGVKSIITSGKNLVFTFSDKTGHKTDLLFESVTATVSKPDSRTVYLRFSDNYFEPKTLMMILRKIFQKK